MADFFVICFFYIKKHDILQVLLIILMIPGSKGLNPHELAQMWVNALETRQNMSIKVGCKHHDMRIFCRIVGVRST